LPFVFLADKADATNSISLLSVQIPAGQSVDIDETPLASLTGVKYLIKYKNLTDTLFKTVQLTGIRKQSDVSDVVDSVFGDVISTQTQFLLDGSDAKLRIINGEGFPLQVNIFKFTFD
jgi:hypothetical protein